MINLKIQVLLIILIASITFASCKKESNKQTKTPQERIKVIFDTDANNELDDQHALAYLLFNGNTFDVKGVTVNATSSGGDIDSQYEEAKRIMQLATLFGQIPLLKGANGSFSAIQDSIMNNDFDGHEAVEFIIDEANKNSGDPLILLAVGKLTNLALALKKDPAISSKIRIVWLGSNYPKPGEYNQDNDTIAMNYLLNQNVPFEMVTVRYGEPSGTAAVTVTKTEIEDNMPGMGPKIDSPITGRHGGSFTNFGDYSVNLFQHIDYHDESQSRALFDMVAVAIVKDPSWGQQKEIPAPVLINNEWTDRPNNRRKITLWENFDKQAILDDFYNVMGNYELASSE